MLDRETKPATGRTRSKIFLSVGFIFASAAYVYWQYLVQLSGGTTVAKARPQSAVVASMRPDSPTIAALPPEVALTEPSGLALPPASPTTAAPGSKTTPATQAPVARVVTQAPREISVPQEAAQSVPLTAPPVPPPLAEADITAPPVDSVAPTVAEVPQPIGRYADGEYTGNSANTVWGLVQVKAIVHEGAITDVQILEYPFHRRRSAQISSWAMPMLASEAIQAQSAEVDIVTQASITSYGFQQSLSSALVQAKK